MFKRTLVTFVALCSLTAMAPAAFAAGETHVMLTTSAGNIELALDSQKAPVSTQNFVDYVNSGFLQQHHFPPCHSWFYGAGRRFHLRHAAENDKGTDQE
ncbi:Peptidyl-prolyl cis-trans isomerase A precursor [Serratia odorifera]|uniref:Peptidyl-prolyl cis-trans isomerase A n=1 Tax=Serratia odorifera TaxID=618 RepID=A0A447KNK0_SEROD|nr:peptidylprolyl isomerase [Serratia odorifera]VDZ54194.1 Peptidyl-prolyl cis-trans isomerase A precursor [Serratia odorifera]